MKTQDIKPITFNEFEDYPVTPNSTYLERIQAVRTKMKSMDLDFLVIFSDREHSVNQEYLLGVGPRFEESILVIGEEGDPAILLGNECQYYAPDSELQIKTFLFQDFSPAGMPRSASKHLAEIFKEIGIGSGQKIGCVGWKTYSKNLILDGEEILDIPSYLATELSKIVGNHTHLVNATEIFTGTSSGLRMKSDLYEIAQFEYAARVVSNAIRDTTERFQVGIRERDLDKYLVSNGLTLTCHKMISFGEKVRRGLSSPSDNVLKLGDPYCLALGVSGALTARAGMFARNVHDISEELQNFFPEFSFNYWSAVIKWYESRKLGETGGNVFSDVHNVIDDSLYTLMLNPGHNLHLEEWAGSIFSENNSVNLYSGMVLQSDLIPISKGPFCYSNAEDGVVLADQELRTALQNSYPQFWERVLHRRKFLRDEIGLELDESVLPLSDTCGLYAPYALSNNNVYVKP